MAYTVLDSKNIDKKKNIYTFGGSGTKPEREDIAENSKLIDYSSGEKFYYDPTKAAGSKWQSDKEPIGGGSLPANFPAEGSTNANKFIGFDENGDYTAKEGGSGGGQLFVTLSSTEEEGNTVWSADKTIAEIIAAHDAGETVIGVLTENADGIGVQLYLALDAAQEVELEPGVSMGFVKFSGNGASPDIRLFVSGFPDGSSDSWDVDRREIATRAYVDTEIESATNERAPLIVNLTVDTSGENSAVVGDKTFGEIFTAFSAGKNVVAKANVEGSITTFQFGFASKQATTVSVVAFIPDKKEITGNESDYFSIPTD